MLKGINTSKSKFGKRKPSSSTQTYNPKLELILKDVKAPDDQFEDQSISEGVAH